MSILQLYTCSDGRVETFGAVTLRTIAPTTALRGVQVAAVRRRSCIVALVEEEAVLVALKLHGYIEAEEVVLGFMFAP